MAPKNTLSRTIFSCCCFESKSVRLDQKNKASKQYSFRGITVSDSSNPGIGSPISSEISNSLIGSNLHAFSLMELEAITQHFSPSNFLGEGGFGPVHKGFIDDKMRKGLEAQPVAVKLLDLEGNQGYREWMAEVIFLGQLRHPHLVKLIGYCCEDEHRLLVYEYMARGNLDNQLFTRYSIPLPWLTRIKIAVGAAKGLAFLHGEEMPVIYRDLKASNILLDSDYTAKLSDFGLARDGPQGDRTHVTTRVMGTQGYAAPEYIMTGHLTTMSDVYSFGVVLVELLTGRRAMDKSRPSREQCLVEWARPQLKDPQKLERFMDPRLEGQYSTAGAKKAAALAYRCLSHNPQSRPTMSHVVNSLEPLMDLDYDTPVGSFVYSVPSQNDVPEERNEEEQKEEEQKENGPNKCPKGDRHRRRLRSRAVYSDTALYKTLRNGLNSSNRHKDGN